MMLYVNLLLIAVFLAILGKYLYSVFREGLYRPEEWARELKQKKISPALYREFRNSRDKIRFYAWWLQVVRLKRQRIPGSFAELGVYKGESARALHLMDPGRRFHLFDTFTGFRKEDLETETGEAATYSTLNFSDTSVEKVRHYLGDDPQWVFHPGHFPDTAAGLENETFALVSVDADLYQPTRAALEFFYPRLAPGGVILVHDYTHKWEGCRKAVDEFLQNIPETPVILPDTDSTIVITRNIR